MLYRNKPEGVIVPHEVWREVIRLARLQLDEQREDEEITALVQARNPDKPGNWTDWSEVEAAFGDAETRLRAKRNKRKQ